MILKFMKGDYTLSKEDFEKLVNSLKEKLDETTNALVSEELLAIISAFNTLVDDKDEIAGENTKLKDEKEELLKVNGKLYQRIGFDKEEEPKNEEETSEDEEIKIEDVIDEKGDIKDE